MRAGIGLGSNLGDRLQNLVSAVESLKQISADPSLDRVSSVYETSPVGCEPGTPGFLNAAMEIETHDDPLTLLAHLQALEQQAGRPIQRLKNSPRSLDLDLLYVDDLTLHSESLTLPHPFVYKRQFVLFPLSEISPNRTLPNHSISFKDALETLKFDESDKIIRFSNLI